jgi:hypothetical protein
MGDAAKGRVDEEICRRDIVKSRVWEEGASLVSNG